MDSVTVEVHLELPVTTEIRIELPEPGLVELRARDDDGRESPARWTFVGIGETEDPVLGPGYRIEGAGNTVFTALGRGEVLLPPGDYRVLATRGPGYESWETEVSLDPGKELSLSAELQRLVPEDWVAAEERLRDAGLTPRELQAARAITKGADTVAKLALAIGVEKGNARVLRTRLRKKLSPEKSL